MSEQTDTEEKPTRGNDASEGGQQEQSSGEKRRPRRTSSAQSSERSTGGETSKSRPAKAKSAETKSGSAGARVSAVQAVKKAVEQFSTLTGRAPESVVGTRWEDDHWAVRLEVVESRRIPDTADLLAEYDVELDGQGELLAYSRKDRYVRGRPAE